MNRKSILTYVFLGLFLWETGLVYAQDGNQILDGIGETAIIARYRFDGDAKDWSRNNLHARIHGVSTHFVEDDVFGKVLSLPGEGGSYITIPGDALLGEESLSITGWMYLRSAEINQRLFDFGKDGRNHFFAVPTGTQGKDVFQVQVVKDDNAASTIHMADLKIQNNQWVHFAIVLDFPAKSMVAYINGEQVGKANLLQLQLQQLFTHENLLYIGKSIAAASPSLNAKIYDFRLYSIPLSEGQIAKIVSNALKEDGVTVEKENPDKGLPQFDPNQPQLYNAYLIGVPDIEVKTHKGYLPRLPRYIEGVYSNGIRGPKVRVLWPSPKDNTAVLKPGSYEVVGRIPGTNLRPKAKINVAAESPTNTPERQLEVFGLDQVTLNNDIHGHKSKFIENRDKFIQTLVRTDPDAFLYMFRNAFGQPQPRGTEPLGVWDSQETKLRGHATGHYLTALAQAYAGTGDNQVLRDSFANKMKYMVDVLFELSQLSGNPRNINGAYQDNPTLVPPSEGKSNYDSDLSENGIRTDYWNWGKGYISAYPPDQFILLERGATYGTQPTQIWAPYYTLHKILAGLMDIYEVSGNKKALSIAEGMGNWVHARLSHLPTETLISMWNRYIAGEFGGMNEAMARLSRLTGAPKYLDTAKLFDNIEVFFGDAQHSHGLAKNVDTFRGLHANQHIPQIMGALEIYRDARFPEYYSVADNFWYKVQNDYMYSIGGVAGASDPTNAECFIGQPGTLYENGFSEGGQNETCATYNMLKLTKNLFLFNRQPELMDYYERGLYNHILASVAEDSPANTYHVSLRPGSMKHFGNAEMKGFTCCNGTALESSTKLQNAIYFKSKDNQELYVNLFVPSTLCWEDKNITIAQRTAYPKEHHTQLVVEGYGKFDLKVRVPDWAIQGYEVKINGKKVELDAKPGTYLTLARKWKNGDTIDIDLPFSFHLKPVMDQQNIASLFYGPVLLAAQEPEARDDWRKIALHAEAIGRSIQGDPETLHFTIDGIPLKPFYETYGRHSVYFDIRLK